MGTARCDSQARPAEGAAVDLEHIVGDLQHWLDRLGLKVPRALCGELMVAAPGNPGHARPDAPICPRCADLAGWDADQIAAYPKRELR